MCEGLQFYEAKHFIFYYIQQPKIQMHKHKYYKPPKPSNLPQKPINVEIRPEFTTDFTDPDKYKLSEMQMVQRKAALQSKNKEVARLDLEERRKKLQMGIIDQETRKIYQTALLSKKIDLNPSIRRNLSQMIQYQREKSRKKFDRPRDNNLLNFKTNSESAGEQNQEENKYQTEIKNAQNLIKKLERAKKQQNINKALGILYVDDKKSQYFGPLKLDKKIEKYEEGQSHLDKSAIQEQTLSNIEETIKFMEEKLFKTDKIKTHQSFNNKNQEKISIEKNQKKEQKNKFEKQQITYESFQSDLMKNYISSPTVNRISNIQIGKTDMYNSLENYGSEEQFNIEQKLSELKLNFHSNVKLVNKRTEEVNQKRKENQFESFEEDDQQTIRKMKEIMEINSHLFDNSDCFKYKQNQKINKYNHKNRQNYQEINVNNYLSQSKSQTCRDGDMQIDFSLTLNQDQFQLNNNRKVAEITSPMSDKFISSNNYFQMKKSLFEEISKLQQDSRSTKEVDKQFHMKNQFKKRQLNKIQPEEEDEDDEQYEKQQQIPVKYQFKNNIDNKKEENDSQIYDKQMKQIDNIKNLIEKSKSNINKTNGQIQSMTATNYCQKGINMKTTIEKDSNKIMGFDYRGSINIKKHINSGSSNFKIN